MWASVGKACMAVLNWAPPAKYVVPVIAISVVAMFVVICL